jgi:hypothetical protein
MITYSDYLAECNVSEELMSFGGQRYRNKEPRPIKEKRFNKIRDFIQADLSANQYSSKEEAKEALEIKIQKMGPIEFVLFRALISWLVFKFLDLWFK